MLIPIGFLSGTPAIPNSYELISTTLVGTATSAVTFSSIPTTYKHLQIRASVRGTYSNTNTTAALRFNGSTGTVYANHEIESNSSGFSYNQNTMPGLGYMQAPRYVPAGTNIANAYAGMVLDIIDYLSTVKVKTMKGHVGWVDVPNNEKHASLPSGMWFDTTAINSITFFMAYGNIEVGSRISLYGIKG